MLREFVPEQALKLQAFLIRCLLTINRKRYKNTTIQLLCGSTMNQIGIASLNYRVVRDRIRSLDPTIDDDTLADTVDGLTDLHEILAAVIRSALQDEALAAGLKARIGTMQARLERLQERAVKRRDIARDVMIETDIKKITAPDFTISIRPGSPSLVVIDEGAIPMEFWVPRDPRLDRQALLSVLKQTGAVFGCELSNPQPVLSVRTK